MTFKGGPALKARLNGDGCRERANRERSERAIAIECAAHSVRERGGFENAENGARKLLGVDALQN